MRRELVKTDVGITACCHLIETIPHSLLGAVWDTSCECWCARVSVLQARHINYTMMHFLLAPNAYQFRSPSPNADVSPSLKHVTNLFSRVFLVFSSRKQILLCCKKMRCIKRIWFYSLLIFSSQRKLVCSGTYFSR